MSAPAPNFDISTQTLDAISFVAVYPSKDCDGMKVLNLSGQVMLIRSNPTDAGSELPVNNLSIFPSEYLIVRNSAKFRMTVPFCYAKLAAGAGDVKKFCG